MFGKSKPGEQKLSGPKGMPDLVGRHMVVEQKKNPDSVWGLKSVVRPASGKNTFFCRVYDDQKTTAAGVVVKDWTSLDGHAELILWEGYFNKDTNEARLEKFTKTETA